MNPRVLISNESESLNLYLFIKDNFEINKGMEVHDGLRKKLSQERYMTLFTFSVFGTAMGGPFDEKKSRYSQCS